MFGIFRKKMSVEYIIKDRIPITDFQKNVLVFKNYYVSNFSTVSNSAIVKMSDQELCFSIMSNLLKQDQCTLMFCGRAAHAEFGLARIPILFFDTYIFIGISLHDSIAYCFLNPIIESSGLATFDGMDASIRITSLIVAIRNDENREAVVDLLYKDADLIIRRLIEISEP